MIMKKNEILSILRRHEDELRQLGVRKLSLFGSAAKDRQRDDSDVDVALELASDFNRGLIGLEKLRLRLMDILGCPVDVVTEPVSFKPRLQREIDRYRAVAF